VRSPSGITCDLSPSGITCDLSPSGITCDLAAHASVAPTLLYIVETLLFGEDAAWHQRVAPAGRQHPEQAKMGGSNVACRSPVELTFEDPLENGSDGYVAPIGRDNPVRHNPSALHPTDSFRGMRLGETTQ
jgi:hypothetical protein